MIKTKKAFTIVELVIVVAIIAILAVITIVSYSEFSDRAKVASIKSDLSTNSTLLKSYSSLYGSYPTSMTANCPTAPKVDNKYCLKPSSGNSVTSYTGTSSTFTLVIANGTLAYKITESSAPTLAANVTTFAIQSGSVAPNYQYAYSIAATSDGGYVTTGILNTDAYIAKYSSIGQLVWMKVWATSASDIGNSIIQTSDLGFMITGTTGSSMFVAKYDSNGNLSWSKTWAGTSTAAGYAVIQTSDGGYAVTGTLYLTTTNQDMFLVKYDSIGNLSWQKTWGSPATNFTEYGKSLIQQSDGSIIVTGTTDFGNTADIAIVSFSSTGTINWAKTWGTTGSTEVGRTIVANSDGGFTISGDQTTAGIDWDSINGLLLRYDSAGNLQWSKTWGWTQVDAASTIKSTDGGFITAGTIMDPWGAMSKQYILKTDSSGSLVWVKTFENSAAYYYGTGIVSTSDGGFAVTGFNSSSGNMLLEKYNSSGVLQNCTNTAICSTFGFTVVGTTGTVSSPVGVLATQTFANTTATPTLSTFTPTVTTIVAP